MSGGAAALKKKSRDHQQERQEQAEQRRQHDEQDGLADAVGGEYVEARLGDAGAVFFFYSRRRHTSFSRDWSSDVCSSDLSSARSSSGSIQVEPKLGSPSVWVQPNWSRTCSRTSAGEYRVMPESPKEWSGSPAASSSALRRTSATGVCTDPAILVATR